MVERIRPSMRQCRRSGKSPSSINQATIDRVAAMPVVMQQQVPQAQTAQKPVEVPINEVTKHAVAMQRQVPRIQTSAKTVEVPPAQFAGTVVDVPVIMQITPLMARQVHQFQSVLKTRKVPQVQLGSVCTHRSLMCQCLKK